MSTAPKGLLTDAEIEHFYALARQRKAPRTAVLSARVTLAARQHVQALSRAAGTTPSRYLGRLLTMLADSDNIQPTREQLATLKKVCVALGISADSDGPSIKAALVALLEATAVPEPSNPDPLEAGADPQPVDPFATAKLSRELAARGMTRSEFDRRKAETTASMRRNTSKRADPLADVRAARRAAAAKR